MKLLPLLFASLLTTIATPTINLAADVAQDVGPEIIKLKMGDIYLPVRHWNHQKLANNECFDCHKPQEWKIKKWDKDVAHQMCVSCHDQLKKGPAGCKACHSTA